jgi:hypothetical protein
LLLRFDEEAISQACRQFKAPKANAAADPGIPNADQPDAFPGEVFIDVCFMIESAFIGHRLCLIEKEFTRLGEVLS